MKLKAISGIVLTLLLIGMLTLAFDVQPATASLPVHNVDTGEDFATIQAAIDDSDTLDGHTVLVDVGTYYECVIVNKAVTLIGEDASIVIPVEKYGTVFYLENVSNVVICGFTIYDGNIRLNRSANCVVSGNMIERNLEYSILLEYSDGNTVDNNTLLSSHCGGVGLYESNKNVFTNNKISLVDHEGFFIVLSDDNLIGGNEMTLSGQGISLCDDAGGNIIKGNTISKNDYGILTLNAHDNAIYHNNLVNNKHQIYIFGDETNMWDDGFPSGGNYWSDHNPPDIYSGPYQNGTGSDGIGDIPYVIDVDNQDRFPLIYPYGYVPSPDVDDDGIVDITDVVITALAFGSYPGHPRWNPIADIKQDGIINIFDLVIIGVHFGETW